MSALLPNFGKQNLPTFSKNDQLLIVEDPTHIFGPLFFLFSKKTCDIYSEKKNCDERYSIKL